MSSNTNTPNSTINVAGVALKPLTPLRFIGTLINCIVRGTSTSLTIVTAVTRTAETAAIESVKYLSSKVETSEGSLRQQFGEGFNDGELVSQAFAQTLNDTSFDLELDLDRTITKINYEKA